MLVFHCFNFIYFLENDLEYQTLNLNSSSEKIIDIMRTCVVSPQRHCVLVDALLVVTHVYTHAH